MFGPATATRVWDAMKHAAAFAFNKSHSYAYGTLAYTTAFLKANWPVEYGAAGAGTRFFSARWIAPHSAASTGKRRRYAEVARRIGGAAAGE
ncbi:hypothetical protein ACVBEQ_17030 [Nakamurella sp. GG22]